MRQTTFKHIFNITTLNVPSEWKFSVPKEDVQIFEHHQNQQMQHNEFCIDMITQLLVKVKNILKLRNFDIVAFNNFLIIIIFMTSTTCILFVYNGLIFVELLNVNC